MSSRSANVLGLAFVAQFNPFVNSFLFPHTPLDMITRRCEQAYTESHVRDWLGTLPNLLGPFARQCQGTWRDESRFYYLSGTSYVKFCFYDHPFFLPLCKGVSLS